MVDNYAKESVSKSINIENLNKINSEKSKKITISQSTNLDSNKAKIDLMSHVYLSEKPKLEENKIPNGSPSIRNYSNSLNEKININVNELKTMDIDKCTSSPEDSKTYK